MHSKESDQTGQMPHFGFVMPLFWFCHVTDQMAFLLLHSSNVFLPVFQRETVCDLLFNSLDNETLPKGSTLIGRDLFLKE